MSRVLLGLIYKVTSPSKKVYIGKTIQKLNVRKSRHFRDANNSNLVVYNSKFYKAIRKYGDQLKWEVIEDNIPIELLNIKECEYIQGLNSYRNGYNETLGGDGGSPMLGKKQSEETKKKIRESNLKTYSNPELRKKFQGENSPTFGIEVSQETREKMRAAKLGKKLTEEHKSKIGRKNEDHPMYRHDITDQLILDTFNIHKNIKDTINELKISRTMFYWRMKKIKEVSNG